MRPRRVWLRLRTNLSMGLLRQVLQALLAEEVPIRDFERIAEALVDASEGPNKDVERLIAVVRQRLGRFIVTQVAGSESTLKVAVLQQKLEELVSKSVRASRETGIGQEIEAETATHLRQAAQNAARAMRARGQKPVLVVQGALRRAVARTVTGVLPVLGLEEIPETMPLQVVQTAEPAEGNDALHWPDPARSAPPCMISMISMRGGSSASPYC